MSLQECLYSKYTVPDVLEAYIKELSSTDNIQDNLHANKLTSYRNIILDKNYIRELRTLFNEIYSHIEKKHSNLSFFIDGRRKSLLSLESKILNYSSIGKSLDLIRDFFAFRIIVFGNSSLNLTKYCYDIVEEIIIFAAQKGFTPCERLPLIGAKSLETPENNYFDNFKYKKFIKDYICFPKENGYKSLHLVLVDTKGRHLEIQVRSLEMHAIAESGYANHKDYKESKYNEFCIPLEREKVKVLGYVNSEIDFSGVEKSLSIFQRQKTF